MNIAERRYFKERKKKKKEKSELDFFSFFFSLSFGQVLKKP